MKLLQSEIQRSNDHQTRSRSDVGAHHVRARLPEAMAHMAKLGT